MGGLKRPLHLQPVALLLDDNMSVAEDPSRDKMDEKPMLNMVIEINVDTFRNIKVGFVYRRSI